MNAFVVWWRGTGRWGWAGAALVGLALTLFVALIAFDPVSDRWVEHGSRQLGSVSISVFSRGAIRAGGTAAIRLALDQPLEAEIGINGLLTNGSWAAGEQELILEVPEDAERFELIVRSGSDSASFYLGRAVP
ncbi:MAG: hypothetical protein AAGE43_06490 [Pseudomonadota bacterium]